MVKVGRGVHDGILAVFVEVRNDDIVVVFAKLDDLQEGMHYFVKATKDSQKTGDNADVNHLRTSSSVILETSRCSS